MAEFTVTKKDIWGLSTLIATEYIVDFPSYKVSFNICDPVLDTDKTFVRKIKEFYRDFSVNKAVLVDKTTDLWTFEQEKAVPTHRDVELFIHTLRKRIEAKYVPPNEDFVDVADNWGKIKLDVYGVRYIFRDDGVFWRMTDHEDSILISYI